MKKVNFTIFISGRGSNMEAILTQCRDEVLGTVANPVLVLSNNPDAQGLAIAEKFGIKTTVVTSKGKSREVFEREILSELLYVDTEYIVLAGFNRIISPVLISRFPQRIINIHPADTKAYQGLHGYAWAYEQKLTETKVTVHYVDEGVDTGEIILQESVDLVGVDSVEEVSRRGLIIEHQAYSKALYQVFSKGH